MTEEETIEEAAERMEQLQQEDCEKMKLYFDGGSYALGFQDGAKWQAERMYSEEHFWQAVNLAYVSGGLQDSYGECVEFIKNQLDIK